MTFSTKSSVSSASSTEVVLEPGKRSLVARHGLERAELQPLAAEVLGERLRLRVAQHAPDLEVEHSGIAQRAGIRRASELWRPACWPR
jgi:hypothetical protein